MDVSAISTEVSPILIGTTNTTSWSMTLNSAGVDLYTNDLDFGNVLSIDPMVPYIYMPMQ